MQTNICTWTILYTSATTLLHYNILVFAERKHNGLYMRTNNNTTSILPVDLFSSFKKQDKYSL